MTPHLAAMLLLAAIGMVTAAPAHAQELLGQATPAPANTTHDRSPHRPPRRAGLGSSR